MLEKQQKQQGNALNHYFGGEWSTGISGQFTSFGSHGKSKVQLTFESTNEYHYSKRILSKARS